MPFSPLDKLRTRGEFTFPLAHTTLRHINEAVLRTKATLGHRDRGRDRREAEREKQRDMPRHNLIRSLSITLCPLVFK